MPASSTAPDSAHAPRTLPDPRPAVARLLLGGGISRRRLQQVLVANLAGQVLIVLSGGVVRLTGSGLGCPTFPECVHGSLVPVVRQPQGFHKYIEFGNRMLTFVLTALAVATLFAVWRWVRSGRAERAGQRARRIFWFGVLPLAGVFAQALIGGISVLTKLNPTVVSIHFLTSMCLIVASSLLLLVAVPPLAPTEPMAPTGSSGPSSPMPSSSVPSSTPGLALIDVEPARPGGRVRLLAVLLGLATVPVLILGTVVTGSGPHSGDATEASRFHFDIVTVAHLHAGAVWVYVALLAALVLTLRRTAAPVITQRRSLILLAITLAQGVIGYVQYALGVPIGLVAAHMLGASLLVVGTTFTLFAVLHSPRRLATDEDSRAGQGVPVDQSVPAAPVAQAQVPSKA